MHLLLFLVFGFVVGLIARAVMPGTQSMGIVKTTLIGAGGSFIGGVLGNLISGDPWGRILAVSDFFSPGDRTLTAQVPIGGFRTLYARTGDLFAWLCVAGLVAALTRIG